MTEQRDMAAEFAAWMKAQGYPRGIDYAYGDMGEAFVAGAQAERGLAVTNGGAQTGMRLHDGEDWPKTADVWDRGDDAWLRLDGQGRPVCTLRRVGWLDQKGRVWTETPPSAGFDGGSLTPLLIDAREDGH